MGYYNVTITEHLAKNISVEADDLGEAIEKAEAMVNESEVVLDAVDFIDRDFEAEETQYPALSECSDGYKLLLSLTDSELTMLEAELVEYLKDKDTDFCDDSTDKSLAARWYEGLISTSDLIAFFKKEA